MQTLEQSYKHAADPRLAGPSRIYRLAYLLTGQREASVAVTLEALDFDDDRTSFFSNWMQNWSRRLVIAKALATIRGDLAVSARRTASKRPGSIALPPRTWSLNRDTTAAQLERALLAIDMFPRCALLLSVFEGVALEDAAVLLDAAQALVRKARIIGLRELTRNLARMQGWSSTYPTAYAVASGVQHA